MSLLPSEFVRHDSDEKAALLRGTSGAIRLGPQNGSPVLDDAAWTTAIGAVRHKLGRKTLSDVDKKVEKSPEEDSPVSLAELSVDREGDGDRQRPCGGKVWGSR